MSSEKFSNPHEFLLEDPALGDVVRRYGPLDITASEDPFARIVVSVINQQLSTQSAESIRSALFDEIDVTPGSLLEADEDRLRGVGLSGAKVDYLRNIARAFQEGRICPDELAEQPDEVVVNRLKTVRGIGEWTARMFLIFGLGREDVFAVKDLGIRRGMKRLFGDIPRKEMVHQAREWKPFRSYACRYLWKLAHEDDFPSDSLSQPGS